MDILPASLQPPSRAVPSTLERVVASVGDPDSQQALLAAVDWQTPDLRRLGAWDRGGGTMEAVVAMAHPLCAFVHPHGGALFDEAVHAAHRASQTCVRMEFNRTHLNLSDWAASSVIDTVCAQGSLDQVRVLMKVLAQRKKLTRRIEADRDDGINPWQSMARYRAPGRDADGYRRVLRLLDTHAREEWLPRLPAQAGTGPRRWQAWERRMRANTHACALLLACRFGNEPMARAVLAMGKTSPRVGAMAAAVESGMLELALEMARAWTAGNDGARDLRVLCRALGRAAIDWQAPLPEARGVAPGKLQALDSLTAWLVGVLERTPAIAARKPERDDPDIDPIANLFPALLRADPGVARDAGAMVALDKLAGAHWAMLAQAGDSPWAQLVVKAIESSGDAARKQLVSNLEGDLGQSMSSKPGSLEEEEDPASLARRRAKEWKAARVAWPVLKPDAGSAIEWLDTIAGRAVADQARRAQMRQDWLAVSLDACKPRARAARL